MSASNSVREADINYHLHPQTSVRLHQELGPLIIERGEGIYLFDESGNRYIDGMSGLWCASLGYSEPRLIEAATKQMEKLPYVQVFHHKTNTPAAELAETLAGRAPVDVSKVMFQCSGSEAIDTSIKFCWAYWNALGQTEKKKIITRKDAYHGSSIMSGSVTGLSKLHSGFDMPRAGIVHADSIDYFTHALPGETPEEFGARLAKQFEELILREGPETVAAFFAEPVMGSGGVIPPPPGYFARIQEILKKYDILFLADEVICGFCRTGNYWGSQTYDLEPDLITCAKALTGAYFPMSAIMLSDRVFQGIMAHSDAHGILGHGFTYAGHPVGAAVALETLRIYDEDDILGHVRRISPAFMNGMKKFEAYPFIGEARGVGLMAALQFSKAIVSNEKLENGGKIASLLNRFCQEEGVLTRAASGKVAFAPPLIISEAELEEMLLGIDRSLKRLEEWLWSEDLLDDVS